MRQLQETIMKTGGYVKKYESWRVRKVAARNTWAESRSMSSSTMLALSWATIPFNLLQRKPESQLACGKKLTNLWKEK